MQGLEACRLSRTDEVSTDLRQNGSTVAGLVLVRQLEQLCIGLQRNLQAKKQIPHCLFCQRDANRQTN